MGPQHTPLPAEESRGKDLGSLQPASVLSAVPHTLLCCFHSRETMALMYVEGLETSYWSMLLRRTGKVWRPLGGHSRPCHSGGCGSPCAVVLSRSE